MKIIRKTNKDKDFYSMLGPFLARREIEREIGYRIYDDDGKEWIVAVDNGSVVGFCYLWKRKTYHIGSFYVAKHCRRQGISKKLIANAVRDMRGIVTVTTKNDFLRQVLLEESFTAKREIGGFTEYAKEF